MLPPDDHVHSEWSWDTQRGNMERTCLRAVELGLRSVAFTEHADFTAWTLLGGFVPPSAAPSGRFTAPPLDVAGYLESLQRCRDRFPQLRIRSGVELGEPHWHGPQVASLLGAAPFERILGSLHTLPAADGGLLEIADAYRVRPAADVVRDYLTEVARMIETCDSFAVLAHIDFPVRGWPRDAGPFDPGDFEDEYRAALRALAGTARVLEVNTRVPLDGRVVRWWREAGGDGITFGSDAHQPDAVARGFPAAAAVAEAAGFRPARDPHDIWTRA